NPVQVSSVGQEAVCVQEAENIENGNANDGAAFGFVQFSGNKLTHNFHPVYLVAMNSCGYQNRWPRSYGSFNNNRDFNIGSREQFCDVEIYGFTFTGGNPFV